MNNETLKFVLESNLINFTIAVALLVFFLIKFLPESTKKRREELEQEINAAKLAKAEAEAKLIELEQEIERAKKESIQIIENASISSKKIKSEILDQAKVEVDRLNELALQEIDLQKNTAMENLRKTIALKVYELTAKAIAEQSPSLDQAIKNKTLRDLTEAIN